MKRTPFHPPFALPLAVVVLCNVQAFCFTIQNPMILSIPVASFRSSCFTLFCCRQVCRLGDVTLLHAAQRARCRTNAFSRPCGRDHGAVLSFATRLFGSRAIPGNPPGKIFVENELEENGEMPIEIDMDRLRDTIAKIRKEIGYETYDVSVFLVGDEAMQETNLETRQVDKPTDILSFPMNEFLEPGHIVEPFANIPDLFTLGDMMVDIPYVVRGCELDKKYFDSLATAQGKQSDTAADHDDGSDNDEIDEDDRGVSGAMATVFDPEQRIHMLMIHGMLHLVGYDHEDDDDYELMVSKEEEILNKLNLLPPPPSTQS